MNLILTLLQNEAVQVALIGLLTAGIGAAAKYAVGLAKEIKRRITNELNAEQLQLAREIAASAVRYAEKVYALRGGEEKLNAAMDAADKMLVANGITWINARMLRVLVEAAVYSEIAKADNPPIPVEVTNPTEGVS